MDNFQSSVRPSSGAVTNQHSVVDLPASYGRPLPISEEEIASINVSLIAKVEAKIDSVIFSLQLGGAR